MGTGVAGWLGCDRGVDTSVMVYRGRWGGWRVAAGGEVEGEGAMSARMGRLRRGGWRECGLTGNRWFWVAGVGNG
jgi:hypothetical protein